MFFIKLLNKIKLNGLTILVVLTSLFNSGYASSQTIASAFTTAKRYNLNGQITGIIRSTPGGIAAPIHLATRNTYNSEGHLESVEVGYLTSWASDAVAPANWTAFVLEKKIIYAYDNWGRKLTESLQDKWGITKRVNQYSYDSLKRLDCVAVRMNVSTFGALPSDACQLGITGLLGADRIKKYNYDDRDRIEFIQKAVNTSLSQNYARYTYNAYWEQASVKDANGNYTEYRYDGFGRLKRTVYPSKTDVGFLNEADYSEITYDKNNNIKTEKKRNGSTITFTYDNNNQVIIKDLSNNTYSPDTYYDYDLRGLLLYARFGSNPSGNSVTNVYDGFGNVTDTTKIWNGTSFALSFGYDKNGNRTRITNNGTYKYDFDNLNRPIQISSYISNTSSGNYYQPILDIKYNSIGEIEQIRRNTSEEKEIFTAGVSTDYFYDTAQRLQNTKFSFPANSSWNWEYIYEYNPANQIISLTTTNSPLIFDSKVYIGNENRMGSYIPNGLNQYSSVNGIIPIYDNNGNLINDGGATYQYDDENRLRSTGGTLPASILEYDPLGRLHSVTIAGQQTTYVFDGEVLVRESGTSGGNYLHLGNGDAPVVRINGSPRHLMTDHQGSVVASVALSGSSMSLTNQTYDTFGIPKSSNQESIGYTGQLWLKSLGLYHYKARIYSPKLGRFLQTDPIFYADNMNMYAYVGNDPVNKIDPSGMAQCGSNLTGEKCETALNDADQARNDATTVSNGIKDITAKMATGEKLSDADNATVAAIGEKFGDKFTSEKGLNKLAGGLDKAANKIGARGEGAILSSGNNRSIPFSGGRVPPAYVWSPLASKINLNDKYFGYGSTNRQSIMLHESAHLAGAWRDNYIQDGSNPLFNKSSGYSNADTYSCLVYPGSCGF